MKKIITLFALVVSLAAQAYEPLIREDRIWEYETNSSNDYSDYSSSWQMNFKFDGTEEINGLTYHKLKYWVPGVENPEMQTVAYMREDYHSKRVFILLKQKSLEFMDFKLSRISFFTDLSDNSEVCLYDFNIPDSYPVEYVAASGPYYTEPTCDYDARTSYWPDSPLFIMKSFVRRLSMSFNDRNWDLTQFTFSEEFTDPWCEPGGLCNKDNILIAEGVGNIYEGYLHRLIFMDTPVGNHDHYSSRFVKQTDLDGNVIFDAAWVWPWMGVEETRPDDSAASGQAYDLSGKPTANPAPGTVYIRNGRKEIAR